MKYIIQKLTLITGKKPTIEVSLDKISTKIYIPHKTGNKVNQYLKLSMKILRPFIFNATINITFIFSSWLHSKYGFNNSNIYYSMLLLKKLYTRAAPKVMPPIYFHGNYNRYKEHNNTI
jgi:hypothetical protein